MLTRKLGLKEIIRGSRKYLSMIRGKSLFSLHIEVTRKCNARCRFCDYWKNKNEENRLDDYSQIVRRFQPLHITITGGEPLLRPDLDRIISRIVTINSFVYVNCITNGILLNADRARKLWDAGLHQLSISLDFPDERHDVTRNVPGLWTHIRQLLSELPTAGLDNLCFNTVITKENLNSVTEMVRLAYNNGWKISFSTYNPYKNRNFDYRLDKDTTGRLEELVEELLVLKRKYRCITNSDFYLRKIPEYVKSGGISGCTAGIKWAHVSPDGRIRRCSEKEFLGHWTKYNPRETPPTSCTECWYACRGESEAPLGLKRILELLL